MLRQQGLTLIEVLIALAIVSIALTAIIKASSQSIRGTGYLYNKSIALLVAQEVMNEARLGIIKLGDERQERATQITMLDRDWFWKGSEAPTGNAHISRLHIKVYAREPLDEEVAPLISLDGYRYHAT